MDRLDKNVTTPGPAQDDQAVSKLCCCNFARGSRSSQCLYIEVWYRLSVQVRETIAVSLSKYSHLLSILVPLARTLVHPGTSLKVTSGFTPWRNLIYLRDAQVAVMKDKAEDINTWLTTQLPKCLGLANYFLLSFGL